MLTNNPFADLPALISSSAMQTYIILMVILVVAGTLYDIIHKKSAQYFFENAQKSKEKALREVGGGEKSSIAIKTLAEDVLTSGEFCNPRRRIAHLLTMYGFVIYIIATAYMVFCNTVSTTAPLMWHIGALMVCVGGYWFWFFIRVDVAAEGNSPFRIIRADLFVLSLLASVTLGLFWSFAQSSGSTANENSLWATIFFGLYILATSVLFGGIPWSKFAHMFFKPAAAFEKRMSEANGWRNNMPPPADAPAKFGLGIKREQPRHY